MIDSERFLELQAELQAINQEGYNDLYDMNRENMHKWRDYYARQADKASDQWQRKWHERMVRTMDITLELNPERNTPEASARRQPKRTVNALQIETTEETTPKRRKVRKGTQSCWQCKRRKIKCTFAKVGAKKCDGCRGRNTACVSQEIDEDSALTVQEGNSSPTLVATVSAVSAHRRRDSVDSVDAFFGIMRTRTVYDELMEAVEKYWPDQDEIESLLGRAESRSILSHGTICVSYQTYFDRQLDDHVLTGNWAEQKKSLTKFARRFLSMATLLQGLSSSKLDRTSQKEVSFREIMLALFDVVAKNITNNDDQLLSVEGIECLMMESMFENNSGNLRRAWLVNRKAIAIAQSIGVHKGKKAKTMVVDSATWDRVDLKFMWLRLQATDRYLSLVLGLPQAVSDETEIDFTSTHDWEALDNMEAATINIAGRVLHRNSDTSSDLETTMEIDRLLQKSSNIINSIWWIVDAEPQADLHDEDKPFEKTIRSMMQIAHYHLIIQLHLPHLLQEGTQYDYSRLAVAHASRSVLSLFIRLRKDAESPAYCRGIDFIAFIAGVTLCLAHVEARQQLEDGTNPTALQSLRLQRHIDIGLVMETHYIFRAINKTRHDPLSHEIEHVLDKLQVIESQVNDGGCTFRATLNGNEVDLAINEYASKVLACGGLQIVVPRHGTIRILQRKNIPMECRCAHTDSKFVKTPRPMQNYPNFRDTVTDTFESGEWALNGADYALFDSLGAEWLPNDAGNGLLPT